MLKKMNKTTKNNLITYDFIFFRGIYCVPAAPHNLDAGSVVRATKRLKCIERGDSVVELDNFKSTLQGYKAPLQEVRDSL